MTSADLFRCVALRSHTWFALGSIHVGFVVDEVVLGQVFFPSSSVFPRQYIIPPPLSKLVSGECVTC